MAQQGTINVTTDNIFPIIKQFLYSDQEIFLRELVSNAVDATQKRTMLAQMGEVGAITSTPQVEVMLDADNGTLTVRDAGIGMTAEEIDKYINQIAFSGATEFLEKYKDAEAKQAIIGHFGLGFYSAFMVAERVDIVTRSQREGSTAVKWSCDGSPNFSIEDVEKDTAGTDIVLHISEDAKEYLEQTRIREVLNTYCKFMPVEIVQGTNPQSVDDPEGAKDEEGNVKQVSVELPFVVNKTEPAWTKKPADLSDENY